MNQSTIALKLLTLLASGATFERTVADLPLFKPQIESALDWMKTGGHCSATEVADRAVRLGALIRRKDEAIKCQDFNLAAKLRAEERAVFESFWLEVPTGTSQTVLNVGIDERVRQLSAFLYDAEAA